MRPLFYAVAGLLSLAATSAIAAEKVDQHLDVSSNARINIDNTRGEVTIKAWDKAQVHVQGRLDEDTESFVFEQRGNSVYVQVKTPRHMSYRDDDGGSKLTIHVPAQADLHVKGVSMDVDVSGISGGTAIDLVSGDIDARQLSKNIRLTTVSGDIETAELNAGSDDIRLESVSGDIYDRGSKARNLYYQVVSGDLEASSDADSVRAQSVSGDIGLTLQRVKTLSVTTVSGEAAVDFGLAADGNLKVSSVSGDVKLGFRGDVDAQFELNASAGGDLINELSDDKPTKAKYGPSSTLNFSVGNGSASASLTTVSGDIRLQKK